MRRTLRALLPVLCALLLLAVPARALTVEQTQVNMPEIDVFLYEDGTSIASVSPADVSAALDGTPLTVLALEPSEEPILYVYMLDISGSMPAGHFAAAKNAVLTTRRTMGDDDRLMLLTFGNDVSTLLSGGESYNEVAAALDSLRANDQNTRFFDAMDRLIEVAYPVEDMRRIAVVISDGIDDTNAGMTQEELEARLTRCGISVNALCIDTSPEASVDRFRRFMHLTGGELYLFGPDNAETVLEDMTGRLDDGWHLRLSANSNMADGSTRALTIDFGGAARVETNISLDKATPDATPPEVLWAEYDRVTGRITVAFSEAVRGADAVSAYALTDEAGRAEPLDSAAYSDEDGWHAVLTPAGMLDVKQIYTLAVSGVTDASQEANPLSAVKKLYPGGASQAASPAPVEKPERSADLGPFLLLGAAAVLAAALIAAVVLLIRRRGADAQEKKPEKKKEEKPKLERQTARFTFTRGGHRDGE